MNNLFESEKIILPLENAIFEYYPNFFSREKSDELFDILYKETPWQQDDITVFGKTHPQPRLTALYGNEGKPYGYSNIKMIPHNWTISLMYIKNEIEILINHHFTTVLLNLYRDGKDSNGWHADNERELGSNPVIASLSLGEKRNFQIKSTTNPDDKFNLELEHGSLLIMKEGSQLFYKHQLPKTTKTKKERINLTFRTII